MLRAAALPLAVGIATASADGGPRRPYHFIAASHNLPDPPKAFRGGEDASFYCAHSLGTAGEWAPQRKTLRVSKPHTPRADGVGGWAEHGVDSGLFSRALMKHTQAYCEERVRLSPGLPVNPKAAIEAGLRTMPNLLGSATATVATLGGDDAVLRVYNIGDSGLQVWRWDPEGALDPLPQRSPSTAAPGQRTGAWRLRFHTESQQTSFNAPLQLAKDRQYSHEVKDGAVSTVTVQPGDLVLATVRGRGSARPAPAHSCASVAQSSP